MNSLKSEQCVDPDLLAEIYSAMDTIQDSDSPVLETCVEKDEELSVRYDADIWLASELHQLIGAYKIRGAYNHVRSLSDQQQAAGVVTSSAGNYGQGIARSCQISGVAAEIFMPRSTPSLKVEQVAIHGGNRVHITLEGSTYDDTQIAAIDYANQKDMVFSSPFNDRLVIAGQGTWGLEIADAIEGIDAVICPVGGMGLIAGISTAIKSLQPKARIIGVEPSGASSLARAIENGGPAELDDIDTFIDGASVKSVGEVPFRLAAHLLASLIQVSNDQARQATRDLWLREEPLKAELAGALSVAALDQMAEQIRGTTVVCLVSGGNLSQARFEQQVL
ncbi:MAG TPA: pyridoxal-phosphate dependent enzyme [Candidatus Saccharimonadales bacterium]